MQFPPLKKVVVLPVYCFSASTIPCLYSQGTGCSHLQSHVCIHKEQVFSPTIPCLYSQVIYNPMFVFTRNRCCHPKNSCVFASTLNFLVPSFVFEMLEHHKGVKWDYKVTNDCKVMLKISKVHLKHGEVK